MFSDEQVKDALKLIYDRGGSVDHIRLRELIGDEMIEELHRRKFIESDESYQILRCHDVVGFPGVQLMLLKGNLPGTEPVIALLRGGDKEARSQAGKKLNEDLVKAGMRGLPFVDEDEMIDFTVQKGLFNGA